jgi:hypothetical protein
VVAQYHLSKYEGLVFVQVLVEGLPQEIERDQMLFYQVQGLLAPQEGTRALVLS